MLKVNVGLSRKLSHDFNSTGFSLNLEGELCVGLDDPVAMIEKVKEFYDLAEEALNQQIERYEGERAIGSRDEGQPTRTNPPRSTTPPKNHSEAAPDNGRPNGQPQQSGNGQAPNEDTATTRLLRHFSRRVTSMPFEKHSAGMPTSNTPCSSKPRHPKSSDSRPVGSLRTVDDLVTWCRRSNGPSIWESSIRSKTQ